MTEFLAPVVVFLAALFAIKGGTWDKKARGFHKLTLTGYLVAILALVGLIVSFIITYNARESAKIQVFRLDHIKGQLELSLENEKSLRDEGTLLKKTIDEARVKIDSYESLLSAIRPESVRQPQQVMAQYVDLRSERLWIAPNKIFGGSIVKLYGFEGAVLVVWGRNLINEGEMRYLTERCVRGYVGISSDFGFFARDVQRCLDNRLRVDVVEPRRGGPSEVAIVGESGRRLPWGLLSLSRHGDGGKVFVESTPRIRSDDWSWVDEVKDSFERIRQIPAGTSIRVRVNKLNVRESPNINGSVVTHVDAGKILIVSDRNGPWVQVKDDSNLIGWIHSDYIEVSD